jgi:hypothetical protein
LYKAQIPEYQKNQININNQEIFKSKFKKGVQDNNKKAKA